MKKKEKKKGEKNENTTKIYDKKKKTLRCATGVDFSGELSNIFNLVF